MCSKNTVNLKTTNSIHKKLPGKFKRSIDVGETMKEPSKISDFIDILSNTMGPNLSFTDEERELAITFFEYNNYYDFSIFPKLLPDNEKQYSFTDALTLYRIDEYIRKEINYFTSRIEKWIKTSLAYNVSHMYVSDEFVKAECYLDPALYTSDARHKSILENFSATLSKSNEPFIKHHYKQRNGCIPVWVLMEELTFGQINTFISALNSDYKNKWSDTVFERHNRIFIENWIFIARHLRNIAAHNGRFFGRTFIFQPKIKEEDMREYCIDKNKKNTLFIALLALKSLISFHTPQVTKEWNDFIENIDRLLNDNTDIIDYKLIYFKTNWKTALIIE